MMTLTRIPGPCAVCGGPVCSLHHLLECGHLESEVPTDHNAPACLEALGIHALDCICVECWPEDLDL
jgi:hypothetical protein